MVSETDHAGTQTAFRPGVLTAIFVGGAAGALARVEISRQFASAAGAWPWSIFLVNLSGAFALGYVMTWIRKRPGSVCGRPLLGTGFCGAFTTFSTMQLELLQMLDRDRYGLAVAYAAASVFGGLFCVHAATALARRH